MQQVIFDMICARAGTNEVQDAEARMATFGTGEELRMTQLALCGKVFFGWTGKARKAISVPSLT